MKSKNVSCVLAVIRRVRQDPRVEHVHRENLRKAQREFEVLGRSGKIDKGRVFRATKLLCNTLVAALEIDPKDTISYVDDPEDPLTDYE